jgi:hypothetical protein
MRGGGTQPERRKQCKGKTYRLVAVTTYIEAYNMVESDRRDWYRNIGYTRMYPDRMMQNMATVSQSKWPEVQNTDVGLTHYGRPEEKYLVWESINFPTMG